MQPDTQKAYGRPKLAVHGDVATLTEAGGVSTFDGLAGISGPPSDARIKDEQMALDAQEVLARLRSLPPTRTEARHSAIRTLADQVSRQADEIAALRSQLENLKRRPEA